MLDTNLIRKDFPVYQNTDEFYYCDSAASALKVNKVIDKLDYYYNVIPVNVHRGVYQKSYEATDLYEESRNVIARHFGVKFEEIVFTRGATASLNLVATSLRDTIHEGDEIISSELEHHSSSLPWEMTCKKKKSKMVYVPLNKEGRITVEAFKKCLSEKTKIVALTHVSNVMGYITPIEEIIRITRSYNSKIIIIVDGAQAAPHMNVNLKELDCDFYCLSGHKLCGPTGIGVLYGKKELLDQLEPVEFGGDMADTVDLDSFTWKDTPYKFEAGTPIIAEAIALKDAFEYLDSIGLENIHNHEKELVKYTLEKLEKIQGVTVYNPTCETGIITFNIDGVHPHDAASFFDQNHVCVRAGHHCAIPINDWLGCMSTLRASFYLYNDKKDCDMLIKSVQDTIDFFSKF